MIWFKYALKVGFIAALVNIVTILLVVSFVRVLENTINNLNINVNIINTVSLITEAAFLWLIISLTKEGKSFIKRLNLAQKLAYFVLLIISSYLVWLLLIFPLGAIFFDNQPPY